MSFRISQLHEEFLKDSGLLVQWQVLLLLIGVIVLFRMELLIESLDSTESNIFCTYQVKGKDYP